MNIARILWVTYRADIFAKANRDRLLKGCIFNDLKRDVLGGSHKFVIEIDDSDFSCQQKKFPQNVCHTCYAYDRSYSNEFVLILRFLDAFCKGHPIDSMLT